MSNLFRLKGYIMRPKCRQAAALVLALATFLAGCRSEFDPGAVNLDSEIARASKLRQPIIVLVTESGAGRADADAHARFETSMIEKKNDGIMFVLLDLSVSRNRAEAARFHITTTPLLLSLSPEGLIVTRDQPPITKELVNHRIQEVGKLGPELDAKHALLVHSAASEGNGGHAQLELAYFLLARQNAREAIPILGLIARSESAVTAQRVRAWVELARAHLWIAEPEKGRHEAEDLITVLGPETPEARAGGNLVLGLQDANAKHTAVAQRELKEAIEAAPESVYAKQAAEALAKLTEGNK